MDGIYHGRLQCDGNGNLLDEDGMPVAYHDGSFVHIGSNEPSHNDRHHKQFVEMAGTVDESMTDDSDLVNADSKNNPHHFEVQPDDPHFSGVRFLPDAMAPTVTSHTDAWSSGDGQ